MKQGDDGYNQVKPIHLFQRTENINMFSFISRNHLLRREIRNKKNYVLVNTLYVWPVFKWDFF